MNQPRLSDLADQKSIHVPDLDDPDTFYVHTSDHHRPRLRRNGRITPSFDGGRFSHHSA